MDGGAQMRREKNWTEKETGGQEKTDVVQIIQPRIRLYKAKKSTQNECIL